MRLYFLRHVYKDGEDEYRFLSNDPIQDLEENVGKIAEQLGVDFDPERLLSGGYEGESLAIHTCEEKHQVIHEGKLLRPKLVIGTEVDGKFEPLTPWRKRDG